MPKSAKPSIRERDGRVFVSVRVRPKASRNSITRDTGGAIRVSLTAPPRAGAANRALCEFMAKLVGVAKSKAEIVSGKKSREKVVALTGVSVESVSGNLAHHLDAAKRKD